MSDQIKRKRYRIIIYLFTAILAAIIILAAANRLNRNDVRAQNIKVTIVPGSTINSIAKLFSRSGLPVQQFLKLALPMPTPDASSTESGKGLGLGLRRGLEGYLYPDTYYFSTKESAQKIIDKMTRNFDAHFPQELFDNQKGAANQNGTARSKRDIVIMASILEKEVAANEDKKIVAGILWKRLDQKLPLQVDSSGHYFLAESAGMIYNTYQNIGLPTGPICNPSEESIKAALDPTGTDYWYFLSTRDGKIIYARTLSEHLINKAKYIE